VIKNNNKRYAVVLASVGNIDFGQDHRRSLPGVPRRVVHVDTLYEASQRCRAYIRDNELGGGNWSGGKVTDTTTHKEVAYVSYNGRVWQPGPYPQPEIEVSP
jgi:hypothetical protein